MSARDVTVTSRCQRRLGKILDVGQRNPAPERPVIEAAELPWARERKFRKVARMGLDDVEISWWYARVDRIVRARTASRRMPV